LKQQGGFKEAEKSQVTILDYSYEAFFCLLQYLYTDDTELNGENVVEVLTLANEYGVDRLKQKCEKFIGEGIEEENVLSFLDLSDTYRYSFSSQRTFCSNTYKMCSTEESMYLLCNQPLSPNCGKQGMGGTSRRAPK
jgi:hypothetical protein